MNGHEACMGEMRNAYRILVANMKGRDHSEDVGVDGRIILIWVLEEEDEILTGFMQLKIGSSGSFL
jgi:hypothetical protein